MTGNLGQLNHEPAFLPLRESIYANCAADAWNPRRTAPDPISSHSRCDQSLKKSAGIRFGDEPNQ